MFQKPIFLAIFWSKKMAKTKFLVEKFLWSESFQNGLKRILKWKYRFQKKIQLWLLSGNITIFQEMGVISRKKWQTKVFGRNLFWSVSVPNISKRILKSKFRFLKFFPIMTFFWGHSRFFLKNGRHSSNHPLVPKDLTRI